MGVRPYHVRHEGQFQRLIGTEPGDRKQDLLQSDLAVRMQNRVFWQSETEPVSTKQAPDGRMEGKQAPC